MNTYLLPSPSTGQLLLLVSPASTLDVLFELVARIALQNSLYVLDGGNAFQGYALARALRRQTPDIHTPLRRVLLSRVFTCYQMAALLADETLDTSPHPILVLDFLATFYDQGVRLADRRSLLKGCLRRLRQLSQRVPVAIWVRQRPVIPEEAMPFLGLVQDAAGKIWTPPHPPLMPVLQQGVLF